MGEMGQLGLLYVLGVIVAPFVIIGFLAGIFVRTGKIVQELHVLNAATRQSPPRVADSEPTANPAA